MKPSYSIRSVAVLATASFLLTACGGGGGGGGGGPPANRLPTAAFTATPAKGMVPLAISVDGSASSDPDGTIAAYQWDFGDGATATGVTAAHAYTKPGRFRVRLNVTDDDGAKDSVDHAVISMSLVAAPSYQVTEIPSLGGYALPSRINNSGQVTGYSYVGSGSNAHAFLYGDGTTRDLGTLGGSSSDGADINDSGDVVGHSLTASGAERAFLYHNGLMHELPTLGGSWGRAHAINSTRTIVGQSIESDGDYRGFIYYYQSGQISPIGTLPGGDSGGADAVNDAGHVAGRSTVAAGAMHAYLLQGATMVDIAAGTSGLDFTVNAMNEADDVVGLWRPGAGRDPTGFLYRDGVLGEITTADHEPSDVNNAGVVVGSAPFGNGDHAFVWDETTGMQDLNDLIAPGLGLTLVLAQGINDAGQIVGYGNRVSNGGHVAILLTPVW